MRAFNAEWFESVRLWARLSSFGDVSNLIDIVEVALPVRILLRQCSLGNTVCKNRKLTLHMENEQRLEVQKWKAA